MPELPEVETIVRCLAPLLTGRRIVDVAVEWPGILRGTPVEELHRHIVGQQLVGLTRRGKYILARLSDGAALAFHLKMTGQLLLRTSDSPPDRFVRATLLFDGGVELRFADARKFGHILLLNEGSLAALERSLGEEPLDPEFTPERFAELLRGRSTRIKALLLDQRLIAGIGNIYADEALFVAGIHPSRSAKSLSPDEIRRLFEAIREVLRLSIINRGTTFSSYRDGFGQQGANLYSLKVYRRHGQPCPRCRTPLERIVVAGRGTHICVRCQR